MQIIIDFDISGFSKYFVLETLFDGYYLAQGFIFLLSSGLIVGPLIQKFGLRVSIFCGGILTATGFIASSFMNNIYAIIVLVGGVSGKTLLSSVPDSGSKIDFLTERLPRKYLYGFGLMNFLSDGID